MTETAKFVSLFDKFFDMLNVTNLTNGNHRRKDFQLPYNSASDTRLNVSTLLIFIQSLIRLFKYANVLAVA